MRAVNLLPPDSRGTSSKTAGELAAGPEVKGGAGPFVVLGVLAACVAGTAAFVLTNNTIEQRKSDLAAVNAQHTAVTAQSNALRPYADFENMTRSRVATVRDIADQRFDWERVLTDLSRAVPADVTLSSLDGDLGSGSGSTASPTGGDSVRGTIAAPAVTLQGCTRNQRSVAELMARLRDVDGVTRVTLSKSINSEQAAAAISEGTSTGAAGPPCGAGVHPTFDVVVFFEDAASSVAAPNTAAAGSATATTPAAGATAAAGAAATPTASATPATPATTTTTTASTTTSQGATTP